jgi:hypothetical protein
LRNPGGITADPQIGKTDRRCWTFPIGEWVLVENLKDMEWTFSDYSPFNPAVIVF